MGWFSRWWQKFDADDSFSFTTPRLVRIQDRWLGVPYYGFLGAVVCYIIGIVIIKNQGFLLYSNAGGETRLQLKQPSNPLSFDDLPYCLGSTASPTGFDQHPCVHLDEVSIVFPADETNAMFVTTRLTVEDLLTPPDCEPYFNATCDFAVGGNTTAYASNVEYYTLLVEHSMTAFNVFVKGSTLQYRGLRDVNDNVVDVCAHYDAALNCTFPPGIFPLVALLEAAGVPQGSLDTPLKNSAPEPKPSRRFTGMVLLLDIVYDGSLALSGSVDNLYYTIRPRFAKDQDYKNQQVVMASDVANVTGTLFDRHGIKIIIRQTGDIGQFNFQALLVSLTSALGLLAVAKTTMDFLAFKVFPRRFIYNQYRTVNTVDFSDVTPAVAAQFKAKDLVNPNLDDFLPLKPSSVAPLLSGHDVHQVHVVEQPGYYGSLEVSSPTDDAPPPKDSKFWR